MGQNRTIDSDLQLRYEKYKSILKELTLMSDVFMRNVFKKRECTEHVLRIIMKQMELTIVDQIIQKDYKNLQGRSAILDCVARDSEGRQFDVEVQQESEGASPKRARYHSGLLDMNTLELRQDYDELKETYVIFITRDDVPGFGFPLYHVKRIFEENDENFKDEENIIYVNSKIQDDTGLGRMMHDFHCKNAEDMYNSILAERVRELKETSEGVDSMCAAMDQIYQEGMEAGEAKGMAKGMEVGEAKGMAKGMEVGEAKGMAKGLEEGELKAKKETVISLAEMGFSVDKIAQVVKLQIQLVQEWIAESMRLAR